jgi:glycosyltransferase involved in cell wall biosynthesis
VTTSDGPPATGPRSLSVVVPCRNGAALLPRQLDALLAQEYDGCFEIIVADNGSTDDTMTVAEGFAARDPRVKVVDASARRGAAFARNEGVRASSGEYLCFVDSDDEVTPGYLAAMGRALAEHEFVAAAYDSLTLNQGWVSGTRGVYQSDGLSDTLGFLPFAGGGGLGIRRRIFEAVGGFDDEFRYSGQDIDFCWRVQLAGTPLHFVPDAVVRIAWRESHRTQFKQGRAYGRGEVYLYDKYRAHGMPRPDWADARKRWKRIIRQARSARRDDAARGRWLRDLGRLVGRVQGSIVERVVYL